MNIQTRNKQQGFTLVEIAIVLVIIGLLLGGVLKGQELIESSRTKAAAADMNGIVTAYNSYIDRYRHLPGDDKSVSSRGTAWASIAVGDADGVLKADATNAFKGSDEAVPFYNQLRAAGFLTGDSAATTTAALPTNPWGGLTGIVNDAAIQGRTTGVKMLMICMGSVPGKAALAMDTMLDDGDATKGTFRANKGAGNTAPATTADAYDEAATYTVCREVG